MVEKCQVAFRARRRKGWDDPNDYKARIVMRGVRLYHEPERKLLQVRELRRQQWLQLDFRRGLIRRPVGRVHDSLRVKSRGRWPAALWIRLFFERTL